MLSGKIALITGGSRGIGRAVAMEFAKNGASIAINYAGNEAAAQETISELKALGVRAEAFKGDISHFDDAKKVIDEVKESFGSIDILVNNAGITRDGLLLRMKEEDFDKVISVNLKGAFNCIRHMSGIMLKQRSGRIINISSVVGITGNAGQANYAAAKAGIIGLTKSAAKELASRGINVNAIAPGFIQTDMTEVLSDKVKEKIMENIPLKRYGSPEDVAKLALFLASGLSDYITGQVINVDGGMVM